jgi:hypothetical protein
LRLGFKGPYNNGTGLDDKCNLTWDKVGSSAVTPQQTADGYVIDYDLPGGVDVGSNPVTLKCTITSGTNAGKSFESQFIVTALYDYVYWTTGSGIGRVRVDGSEYTPEFISGLKDVRAVSIYADKIYFLNHEGIGRADLDGTDVQSDFKKLDGQPPDALIAYSDGRRELLEWGGNGFNIKSNLNGVIISTDRAKDLTLFAYALREGAFYLAAKFGGRYLQKRQPNRPVQEAQLRTGPPRGLTAVEGTPYWTHGSQISKWDASRKDETVFEASDNLYGLGFSGQELITVRIPKNGSPELVRMTPAGGNVKTGPAENANGGLAVGPGRDPAPHVTVEDAAGAQIKRIDLPPATGDQRPGLWATFYLSNTGSAPLSVADRAMTGDTGQFSFGPSDDACQGVEVQPGQRCEVKVAFVPTVPGQYRVTVRIDGTMNPFGYVDVPISGEWNGPPTPPPPPAPAFGVTPVSHNFGTHAVGYPSEYTTFTVANTGNAAMTIPAGGVTLAGPGKDDFDLDPGACDDTSLPPGQSCAVNVLFSPTGVGARTGQLQVVTNATGSPHSVQLTGTGVAPALSFAPNPVPDLDTTASLPVSGTVTVTNDSAADLPLGAGAVQISGDTVFTVTSDGCSGQTLSPMQTCDVQYTFSPTGSDSPGMFFADIEITHSGAGNPLVIPVAGVLQP